MSDFLIQFNGIVVSNENRMYIENCFQSIFSLSPSDSAVSLNFYKTSDGFSGAIIIVSQIKIFEADCQENSIIDVMKNLNKNVNKQLEKWKSHRFNVA